MDTIRFHHSDLASRDAAAVVRSKVSGYLREQRKVVIDFTGVESVSASYSDELFGILALSVGLESIEKYVRIRHARTDIVRQVVEAIERRIASQQQIAAAS